MNTKVLKGFAILAVLICAVIFAQPTHAAAYEVNNTSDSGAGSLRQAIIDANANVGLDDINFNIAGAGPHTITIGATQLPEITDPVNIDGTTQPDGSGGFATCGDLVPATLPSASNTLHNLLIQLDGQNITWIDYKQGILHFVAGSGGSSIKGLSFINAGIGSGDFINGLSVGSDNATPVSDILIECNYFGIGTDGTTLAGNNGAGIHMTTESSTVTIRNNLISANGIQIQAFSVGINNGSVIEENLVGTLADGLTGAASTNQLVDIEGFVGLAVQRNIFGPTDSFFGVDISYTASSTVQNNYFGFNINQGNLPFGGYGFYAYENDIMSFNDNLVGNGSAYGAAISSYPYANTIQNNTFRNNSGSGIFVGGGLVTFSNNEVYNNDLDGVSANYSTISNNNVYSNGRDGIYTTYTSDAVIKGNNVGLDGSNNPAGNGGDGIEISSYSSNSTVGGANPSDRNYIADNVGSGIHIFNDIGDQCGRSNIGSQVFGNYIGTNTSGQIQTGFANGGSGVEINEINSSNQCGGGSVYNHRIGGDNPGEANIIAGNAQDGIRIFMATSLAGQPTDVYSGSFLANSIYKNGNLGINLAYDSLGNGTADTDLGPNVINAFLMSFPANNANYYINKPTINSSSFIGNQLSINYSFQANGVEDNGDTLLATDLVGYRLDFYLNDAGQDGAFAGYSQGKTHLGSFIVNGSETNATHTFTSPVALSLGQVVTASTTVLWKVIPNPCPTPGRVGNGPPYSSTSCEK